MKLPKYINCRGFLCFRIMHLVNKKGLCGDELASIMGVKKSKKLTPGTIYPALKFLRKNKLVKFKQKGRKKIYCLTKKGEKEYKIFKKIFRNMFKDIIKK